MAEEKASDQSEVILSLPSPVAVVICTSARGPRVVSAAGCLSRYIQLTKMGLSVQEELEKVAANPNRQG